MVESLRQQQNRLVSEMQEMNLETGKTLLEAVGYDIDNTFRENLQWKITNSGDQIDNTNLSAGNDFTCHIFDDAAVVDTDSICLIGEYTYKNNADAVVNTHKPINAQSMFIAQSMDVQNLQFVQTYGELYQQQYFAACDRKQVQSIQDGLLINLDDRASYNVAATKTGTYFNYFREQEKEFIMPSHKKRFCLPLKFLFKQLNDFDQKAVFTSNTARMKFVIRVNAKVSDTCMLVGETVTSAVPTKLELTNMHLAYRYAKLDQPRIETVMMNRFSYHLSKVHHDSQSLTESIHFRFVVGQKEKTKRVLFAFHSTETAGIGADNSYIRATDGENAGLTQKEAISGRPFNTPLLMFPRLYVKQITISYGGYNVTYNMQSFEMLDLLKPLQNKNEFNTYTQMYDKIRGRISCVYVLDLSRLPVDLIGSGSKTGQDSQLTINLQIPGGQEPLDAYQSATAVATSSNVGDLASHLFAHAFLETEQQHHLENGRYHA